MSKTCKHCSSGQNHHHTFVCILSGRPTSSYWRSVSESLASAGLVKYLRYSAVGWACNLVLSTLFRVLIRPWAVDCTRCVYFNPSIAVTRAETFRLVAITSQFRYGNGMFCKFARHEFTPRDSIHWWRFAFAVRPVCMRIFNVKVCGVVYDLNSNLKRLRHSMLCNPKFCIYWM